MAKIGIIGAGRWGTALAILLTRAGFTVKLFCLAEEFQRVQSMRESPNLPGFSLPPSVEIFDENGEIGDCRFVFFAVPGENLREVWDFWRGKINPKSIIINTAKTIETDGHLLILPSNIIDPREYAFVQLVVAGFPQPILDRSPTIGTAFSLDGFLARQVGHLFEKSPIAVNDSHDLPGGQIGAALKNIVAIASGLAAGLGFDSQTRSMIIGAGASEICEFALHHLAHRETFKVGGTIITDLYGTSFSHLSRNFLFGQILAKRNLEQTQKGIRGTIEGVRTVQALAKIAHNFEQTMPVASMVYSVITAKTPPADAMKRFFDLARPDQ